VTDLVHQVIIDILKLGNASLKLGGDGEDWIKIIQELEEVRMDFCQCLERRELIQRIYTSNEVRMMNSLKLILMQSPKQQTTKPKTPVHKTSETLASASISHRRRTTFPDNSFPVACRKMEVTVLQDQTALLLPTRTFFFLQGDRK